MRLQLPGDAAPGGFGGINQLQRDADGGDSEDSNAEVLDRFAQGRDQQQYGGQQGDQRGGIDKAEVQTVFAQDDRVEQVILSIRDGLMLIRKLED